jgi:hypothetical protein
LPAFLRPNFTPKFHASILLINGLPAFGRATAGSKKPNTWLIGYLVDIFCPLGNTCASTGAVGVFGAPTQHTTHS